MVIHPLKLTNIIKFFILAIILQSVLYGANVKATVDTVEVVKGNPVTLRIKATGGNAAFPKILMVGNATIVNTSTSSNRSIRVVNGSMNSEVSTTKLIQFMPEHNMTIPSYTVNISGKRYKTDPITIKVIKSNAPKTQDNTSFDLKMKSSKSQVHVGESFMVTVYFSLRSDIQLSQEIQYTKPNLSEFLVADVPEQGAYIKDNYQVQEIRYIVTAQKEGNFTINPAQAKIGLPDRNRRDIFGMTYGTKWYQIVSDILKVEVLPQVVDSDITGDFTLKDRLDKQETKANKPVNLTITIEGKGNLSGFEYPKYDIDGVTVYGDEAKIDTKVVNGELYSIYTKSFAFIAEESFTIPERTFSMYSTKDQKLKELKVKSYDIDVKMSKHKSSVTKINTNGIVQTNEPKKLEVKPIVKKEIEMVSPSWWMLLLAFVLGSIFTYLLRFIPKRKEKSYKESQALKVLYGHTSDDSEIEEMVRKLYAKKNGDKSIKIDKKRLRELVERFR